MNWAPIQINPNLVWANRTKPKWEEKHCGCKQQMVKPTFLVQPPWGTNLKMCSLYLSVFSEDRETETY
jgi:hypothetical protein